MGGYNPSPFAGGNVAALRGTGTQAMVGVGSVGDTFNRIELGADGFIRLGGGSTPTDLAIGRLSSQVINMLGFVEVGTAGQGFSTKEGSNAKQGTAVLVAGSAVVANTSVGANSRIFLTSQVDGGTPGFVRVSTRTAGTSFTITSSSGTDTSTIGWEIFEPGA